MNSLFYLTTLFLCKVFCVLNLTTNSLMWHFPKKPEYCRKLCHKMKNTNVHILFWREIFRSARFNAYKMACIPARVDSIADMI